MGLLTQRGLFDRMNTAEYGEVSERFKEPVLKTGVGQPTEGSNPSPSAKNLWLIAYRHYRH